jgi:peptidoglycan/LPS O-acetylase OafA/YrhL
MSGADSNPVKASRLHGLDTLRAVAILAVMIFHLQGRLPHALDLVVHVGWAGVDLFFVLSGFLIGSQLLEPFVCGERLRVVDFYLRRGFRILPAYLVVVALYFLVPAWREQPGLPALWKFLTFTVNLVMNYPAELAFSHASSLCVEEHFYLVLPVLVVWLMRKPSAAKTIAFFCAVVVFGVLVRSWELFHVVRGTADGEAWPMFMKRIYYPTYCRLDGLVVGVALACLRMFRPAWWAKVARRGDWLLGGGIVISAGAFWMFRWDYPNADETVGMLFGFPLLALGFGLLVAAAVADNGVLRMKVPGAKMVALLAYSLYLTHKEIAHADRAIFSWMARSNGWRAAAVYGVTCFAFAALLYWCVERPCMILGGRFAGRAVSRAPDAEARLDPAL